MNKDITAQSPRSKAVQDALDGKIRGFRGLLPFLGPAFIAAIAYIDPGNFATNISAGSSSLCRLNIGQAFRLR
ncbi:Manganese transport protein mntH [Bacillus subtilis PY79]|nr:Manganese transport protein mntH [Bacillus subtilis PY79]